MTSLVQQAKKGKLPPHQNIDRETLLWIKDNRPQELIGVSVISVAEDVDTQNISRLTPLNSWFVSPKKVNSLHGKRHSMRVAIYASLLSKNIDQSQRDCLLMAAILHDIRRMNDKSDEGHANRAVKWYESNKSEVTNTFEMNNINDEIVVELIKLHEQDYEDLISRDFYLKYGKLVDILKASDALDRYVQPKKKWWIDEKYLNIKPDLNLKAFAFELVVLSEEKYLSGVDSERSVLSSIEELRS